MRENAGESIRIENNIDQYALDARVQNWIQATVTDGKRSQYRAVPALLPISPQREP